jgi:hypothetical protein
VAAVGGDAVLPVVEPFRTVLANTVDVEVAVDGRVLFTERLEPGLEVGRRRHMLVLCDHLLAGARDGRLAGRLDHRVDCRRERVGVVRRLGVG